MKGADFPKVSKIRSFEPVTKTAGKFLIVDFECLNILDSIEMASRNYLFWL